MSKISVDRRSFLKKSVITSTGAALGLSFEEKALLAKTNDKGVEQDVKSSSGTLPTGKIRDLRISRLICGGNLISGFAHSRDLIYVSPLLKHYFTDEKVLETLAKSEENGVNTAVLRVDSHTLRIINRYWNERGGQIQWIAQAKLTANDLTTDIKKAVDAGASAVYIHGGVGDSFVQDGHVDLLGRAVEYIRENGLPGGIGGHALETVVACENAGLNPDFYVKTINSKNYWSARRMPRHDSVWAETPKETIEFMKKVKKPWIGYKVLGAGAIHPTDGFQYAFENGTDFICVGMFDFQIIEDVLIARKTLSEELDRDRPWRG